MHGQLKCIKKPAVVGEKENDMQLRRLILELIDAKNLDKVDKTKKYTVIWNNGHVNAVTAGSPGIIPSLAKSFPIDINPTTNSIRLIDFDDWSSFKDILKMQQAVKDIIRLKLIDSSWNISIPMSDANINIGSSKVGDFLKYDSSFTKVIPKAFHGTTVKDLKNIELMGITPPSKTDKEILKWNSFYSDDSQDKTYWSIDYERAAYYARHAVELYKKHGIRTTPVVIEVNNLPVANITADDDFKSNMSMVQLLMAMQGKKSDADSYLQSIRGTSQFAYKGRVPASMIVKIHKVKK